MKNKLLQGQILTVSLAFMMLVFNIFNVSSNYKSLMLLFGIASWAFMLAIAFAAVDFAGLSRLAMTDTRAYERHHLMLGLAWFLSAVMDTYLSYVVIASQMALTASNNALVQHGIITIQQYTDYIPKGIAVLLLTIQCLLEWQLNKGIGIIVQSRRNRGNGGNNSYQKSGYQAQHKPKFGMVDEDEISEVALRMMRDE
jgi:hypothetical protein